MANSNRARAAKARSAASVEPADKAGLNKLLANKLARTYGKVRQDFRATFADLELRPAALGVLSLIVDNPESTQTAIADLIGVDRSALVPIIDDLERRGLTIRHRSMTDRRAHALKATAAGIALRDQALKRLWQHESRVFACLSQGERHQLNHILDKLLAKSPVP